MKILLQSLYFTGLMSYKWDMNKYSKVNYENSTSIAVFHGEPKPHELDTTWIKEHWR